MWYSIGFLLEPIRAKGRGRISGVTLPFGAPCLFFAAPLELFVPQIFFSRRPNAKLAEIWYIFLLCQKIFRYKKCKFGNMPPPKVPPPCIAGVAGAVVTPLGRIHFSEQYHDFSMLNPYNRYESLLFYIILLIHQSSSGFWMDKRLQSPIKHINFSFFTYNYIIYIILLLYVFLSGLIIFTLKSLKFNPII